MNETARLGPRRRNDLAGFILRLTVAALFVGLALLVWRLRDALSIALGSIVLAVGFGGMTQALRRRTGMAEPVALTLVVAASLGLIALAFQVFGSTIADQFGDLSARLPGAIESLLAQLRQTPLGREIAREGPAALQTIATASGPRLLGQVLAGVGQALTYGLVMVAGGVFLAIEPARYREGTLSLVPARFRGRTAEVMDSLADALRRWLLGRLLVMVVVGVMSSLGLWALGIDAPFALGLTGAILTFIPHIGSVMSALPGMLIAFAQDPIKALAVAVLIWLVHFIEGTFITPYVQDETVDMPPVVSIFSTVVFALLAGPIGVFLAGPFTLIAMVLVNRLYIEDFLGETVKLRPRSRPLARLFGRKSAG